MKLTWFTIDSQLREMLVAMLDREGYDGYEETDEKLYAYVPAQKFDNETVQFLADAYNIPFETEVIGEQNWNKEWEKNFQPVTVDDFCTIRADFHQIAIKTKYDIVITPKMTFGTGHHATTQLMIRNMRDMDLAGKRVFDFGTGTGILAILAEKLGAAEIVAIDNDEWSYENSLENVERNRCSRIKVSRNSVVTMPENSFDVILANINRHILVEYMQQMFQLLKPGGMLLMSGLLKEDINVITESAMKAGFTHENVSEFSNWICVLCKNPKIDYLKPSIGVNS